MAEIASPNDIVIRSGVARSGLSVLPRQQAGGGSPGSGGNGGSSGAGAGDGGSSGAGVGGLASASTSQASTSLARIGSSATSSTTTTPTSAHSSAQSTSAGNNGTVSDGALAGGIVGAFVGGALIACLITYLIMSWRRKNDRKTRGSFISKNGDPTMRPTASEKSGIPLVDPKHAWELHLPQPADDVALRQAVKTLYDRLELHVENFYSNTSSAKFTPTIDEAQWKAAVSQIETPYLPASLQVILQQGRPKMALMKHCIAYLTISGIDVNNDSSFSLLPPELTSIPQAAARARQNKTVLTQALARHAQLSNYLLSPISATLPHYASRRDAVIESAVGSICTAFAPWATKSASMHVRVENLTQILREASDTGIMLCGQPERFFWDWKLTQRESRKIVILPAFIKLRVGDSSDPSFKQAKDTELVAGRIGDI